MNEHKTPVLFIQGGGKDVHDAWDAKLVDSLQRTLGDDFDVDFPRMPDEADPTYERWKPAIAEAVSKLPAGAIVIGHSLGGMMLVNALAESGGALERGTLVLLAAPFIGPGGWPGEGMPSMAGIGRKLPEELTVHLYHGDADDEVPVVHLDLYAREFPHAHVHRLRGRDHQLNNDLSVVATDLRARLA